MQKLITRTTGFALVFGFLFITSCSSLNKAESARPATTPTGPVSEIEIINREIGQNGPSAELLLRKTELFVEAAEAEPLPSLRTPYYRNAYNTSQEGITDYNESASEFTDLLGEAWSFEHNNGVRLLQARSENEHSEGTLNQAINHLENAIIIQPDSLSSYRVLATAYYSGGLYSDAGRTINKLLNRTTDPEIQAAAEEKLAFIYLESGETGKAVSIYEDLFDKNRSSITIHHGLINAYILNNQPEEASLKLEQLTEEYPNRATYRASLASVNFKLFELSADSLLTGPENSVNEESEIRDLVTQLNEINAIYDYLSESSLMDEESIYQAAGYLLNGVTYLEDIQTALSPTETVNNLMSQTQNELLSSSLAYWEQLIDLKPDNIEYLQALYTIYNKLEMFEEAESLEQSYNF